MERKLILALPAILLLCPLGFSATLSTDEIEAHVGMLVMGNYTTDNGLGSPMVLLGASTLLDLDTLPEPWVFGLGLDLTGTWYEWNSATRWAALSEPEWAGDLETSASFFTVGVIVSPRFGARFALGEAVAMGALFGLDLFVRFPFDPWSPASIADEQVPALVYFVAGRFLYPEIGWWMTWRMTEAVELALALRSLWPVWRAWSPEVTGWATFLHQVAFAGTVGMTIRLGKTVAIGRRTTETVESAAAAEAASP